MYYNSYRFSAPTYSIMFIKNRHNEIKIEIIRVKIYSKLVFKTTKQQINEKITDMNSKYKTKHK